MVAFDIFRQSLATALHDCADHRRRALADSVPTGEDLKIIDAFERLAHDAENLDLHAFLRCRPEVAHEITARRFLHRRDFLFEQVGVTYLPRDATDLVRWMSQHVVDRDPRDHGGGPPAEG